MTQVAQKKGLPPIVYILFLAGFAFGGFRVLPGLWQQFGQGTGVDEKAIANRISLGEEALLKTNMTLDKQNGVKAFAAGNYREAVQHFQRSLQQQRNDPEALIYLNNAKAKLNVQPSLKIAVSVPIATNPNVAQEMLRGVAQAQDEVNAKGGVNGRELQVEVASDDNSPDIAEAIAQAFVNDPEIVAVIGHNASNATIAAAAIYQQGQLPMITPTSSANDLSGFGQYIFRTIPTTQTMATPLAQYALQTVGKKTMSVCYDSQSPDNLAFKDEFVKAFTGLGGTVVRTTCDFSAPNFNPSEAIATAKSAGANGLLIAPYIDRIHQAIDLTKANRGQLALFSSPTLYTIQTLEEGQDSVKGLVLPVTWHPQMNRDRYFVEQARQLWGGTVNWRTAMSYDAAIAITTGLKQQDSREGLQQTLRSPNFSAVGAGESVQFLPKGDRATTPILVQVEASGTGYQFSPIAVGQGFNR